MGISSFAEGKRVGSEVSSVCVIGGLLTVSSGCSWRRSHIGGAAGGLI